MKIDPLFNEHCVILTAEPLTTPIKPPQFLALQIMIGAEASNWKPKL